MCRSAGPGGDGFGEIECWVVGFRVVEMGDAEVLWREGGVGGEEGVEVGAGAEGVEEGGIGSTGGGWGW